MHFSWHHTALFVNCTLSSNCDSSGSCSAYCIIHEIFSPLSLKLQLPQLRLVGRLEGAASDICLHLSIIYVPFIIFLVYVINVCCKFNAAAFSSLILDDLKPRVREASSSWKDRYNTGVCNEMTVWRVLMLKAMFPPRICFWHWRFETLVRKTYGFRVNLPVDRNPRLA
jgi:hypothetical protein